MAEIFTFGEKGDKDIYIKDLVHFKNNINVSPKNFEKEGKNQSETANDDSENC